MSFIDVKYINLISSQLPKFARKKQDLYNFRCPYCGDSVKKKDKARGYLYKIKNDFSFKCHNCGMGRTFTNFLKDNFSSYYDQYILERYKQGLTGKNTQTPNPKFNFEKPKFKTSINLPKASTNSIASDYLKKRKLNPINFYYAEKFKQFCNKIKPGTFDSEKNDHPRIIIPFYNEHKELIGLQGRSLNSWIQPKYLTLMFTNKYPKIYGLDTINKKLPIYVVEGPFDSTFINNSIALCGSDGNLRCLKGSDLIYVYDNEPRNAEIVKRIESCIDRGENVVIWPSTVKEKDINDMVLSGHPVQTMVESNTYKGLQAKVKFIEWKRK